MWCGEWLRRCGWVVVWFGKCCGCGVVGGWEGVVGVVWLGRCGGLMECHGWNDSVVWWRCVRWLGRCGGCMG